VLTDVGPVDIAVSRDRDASFEPRIVAKRQRRLTGVDDLVISLVANGLTTGEVQAHLAEVYGAQVSRDTISTITDRVLDGLAEWQSRPLEPVYAVRSHRYHQRPVPSRGAGRPGPAPARRAPAPGTRRSAQDDRWSTDGRAGERSSGASAPV
jgi:hypothetical protein